MQKTLFTNRLTFHARHSIQEARSLAVFAKSKEVKPEHLLLAIFLENGSLGNTLLQSMGFERERLSKFYLTKGIIPKNKSLARQATTTLSQNSKKVIERAYNIASQFQSPYVGTEHLVYALLETEDATLDEVFLELEIDEQKIESALSTHLGFEKIPDFSRLFEMSDPGREIPMSKTRLNETHAHPHLSQYAIELTHPSSTVDHALSGREQEITRLTQILARKQKSNPLLLGDPGVGKTALVSALAERIKTGNVPQRLLGKKIYALDLALLVAGTNFRGEFEARFKEVIREATESEDVILFIDEIHTLIGAGNTSGGLDAANILKPALARGEIQCIGATTHTEFKRHIEKDAALERRFQIVRLEEPSEELTLLMLTHAKESYEQHHQIRIPDELLPEIIHLAARYINDRFFPDKAFDVLDEASTLVERPDKKNTYLRKKNLLLAELEEAGRQKTSLIENSAYEEAETWHNRILGIEKKLHRLEQQSPADTSVTWPQLERKHILITLSRISGVPLHKLTNLRPKVRLTHLRRALRQEIIGQKDVMTTLDQVFTRSLAELEHTDRPLSSLLFLGPTGVGKTLTAKVIAKEFFGDEKALIRLDMSEFMERHSVAQILGAPAGYIGYGEGGKLTEQVRKRPFSVVLFDEIEKAHPDVFNLLLQILDEGFLTDAEGRRVNFRHTLIILTSNIGTTTFSKDLSFGFNETSKTTDTLRVFGDKKNQVLQELKRELRPELLARLDHTLVFEPLNDKALLEIIHNELKKLKKKLLLKGVTLEYNKEIPLHILHRSESKKEGARLIRKQISATIEHIIAETLLEEPQIKTLTLALTNNQVVCRTKK